MKRLYLTVEGQTEQEFAVRVLQPHLATFGVMVGKPRLTGLNARRKGRIPKGGLLNTFVHALGDIRRWLKEHRSDDARFSIMVDLYSLPGDFPGYHDAAKSSDPQDQASKLEEALARELNDPRFIPYVQVHEFEAIVLADPNCFLEWFDNAGKSVAALCEECGLFDSPEEINDGQDTHPKARIHRHFADYDENVDGPFLAQYVGLEAIRRKCPHFAQWLTILEGLDDDRRRRRNTSIGENWLV